MLAAILIGLGVIVSVCASLAIFGFVAMVNAALRGMEEAKTNCV